MKLLVINGPNMNMLGIREPEIYGTETYDNLVSYIKKVCVENSVDVTFFQSNHEGCIVDEIQAAYGVFDAIVINPAAFSHTSIAIADAIRAVRIKTAEVHLSDISNREIYRRTSITAEAATITISGHGFEGYKEAILSLMNNSLK